MRVIVSAEGKQPVDVVDVQDGADVRLRALPNLCVTVKGLPADLPRAGLAVIFRSVVRENLADMAQAPLQDGDVAHVPLPPPGRYHVRLTKQTVVGGGSQWQVAGQRSEDVLIDLQAQTIEFVVDAAMVQRLRELQSK